MVAPVTVFLSYASMKEFMKIWYFVVFNFNSFLRMSSSFFCELFVQVLCKYFYWGTSDLIYLEELFTFKKIILQFSIPVSP